MLPRRARASSLSIAIGSSLRLAEVITSAFTRGRQRADAAEVHTEDRCQAMESPELLLPRCHCLPERAPSTMGRAERLQQRLFLRCQLADCACRLEVAHHHGERLAVAMFALAKTQTASSLVASTARWNPPMPLMAMTSPRSKTVDASRRPDRRTAISLPSADSSQTRGPQSQHALGCA